LPEEFAWLDVRDFPFSTEAQRRVQRDLRAWVAHVPYGPAPWLLLTGPNGVGKTGLACSLTAWLIEHEQVAMARYVVVGDLIDGLHATQRGVKNGIDALFEDLEKVDLLILDEVGEYSAVNWTVERVCRLINQRHAKHLPTIFCTNLSMGGLKGHLGERTMHRILHLSKIVSLQDCPDLRTPPNLPVKIAAVSTASGDAEADNVVPLKAEQRTTGRRTSKRAGTTGATG
jgi:DNA replication protein DnaC